MTHELIRVIRVIHGLTLRSLAVQTGIPMSRISRFERGEEPFDREFEIKIRNLFGLNNDKLKRLEAVYNEIKHGGVQ